MPKLFRRILLSLAVTVLIFDSALASSRLVEAPQKPIDIKKIPSKIMSLYEETRRIAENGTLNLTYVEYLYYDTQAAGRYDSRLIEKNKTQLKAKLGPRFKELSENREMHNQHMEYLKSRTRFYPELNVRQALGRASSKDVLIEKKLAYCADFSKAFIELGLNKGIDEKQFAVFVMAEKKSYMNVCPTIGESPKLNPENLSGIFFGMTYGVMIRESGVWYLVNPEAPTIEVFRIGKHMPHRGAEFEFPFFNSMGASAFVISGKMNLKWFLSGYDISVPTDIGISGVIGERNICR